MVYEIGTAGVALMGLLAIWTGYSAGRMCMYGKATLVYLGLFLLVWAGIRVAVSAGWDRESAGEAIGLVAASSAVTILSIVGLHTVQHWHACRWPFHKRSAGHYHGA